MFGGIGVMEILLVALLVLLLFGARRIPGIARGIGEGIRNFKSGLKAPDRDGAPGRLEEGAPPSGDEDDDRR